LEMPSSIPDGRIGDPGRIRQILLNLVANAIKFTEKGSVTVRVTQSVPLVMEIRDTGPGIPTSVLPRLFRPFQQAEAKDGGRGTGLGLAISMRLAKCMGGTLGVQSKARHGSTFTVTLPLEVTQQPEGEAGQEVIIALHRRDEAEIIAEAVVRWGYVPRIWQGGDAPKAAHAIFLEKNIRVPTDGPRIYVGSTPTGRGPFVSRPIGTGGLRRALDAIEGSDSSVFDATLGSRHPLRILAVEDNTVNLMVLASQLAAYGYNADLANNGLEAIEAAATHSYDLILMDIEMPLLGGLEATRRLRAGGVRSRIMAFSGHAGPEFEQECRAAGMDGVLVKPVTPRALEMALDATFQSGGRPPIVALNG